MKLFCFWNYCIVISLCVNQGLAQSTYEYCPDGNNIDEINLLNYSKTVIPCLEGKRKGENGKIGIIGGSTEYAGAPYFAAISALKVFTHKNCVFKKSVNSRLLP